MMANRKAIEADNRTLRDVRQSNRPIGGIKFLFCDDFRQTLPIIPRGTKTDEIAACLKSSLLWRTIICIHLNINMRAQLGCCAQEFSNLLLKIGGTYPYKKIKKKLMQNLCCSFPSPQHLIYSVYENFTDIGNKSGSWLKRQQLT